MKPALRAHSWLCFAVIRACLRVAIAIDDHRRWADKQGRRLLASLRRLLDRVVGPAARRHPFSVPRRPPWNRTPPHVEDEVARLRAEHPELGAGSLAQLLRRVRGFRLHRETVRKILRRERVRIAEMARERQRSRRRIRVKRALELWGADLTLVWLLGFFPVWLVCVVDYHGSRLVALERVLAPTSAAVIGVLDRAFERHGRPDRLLTDNGGQFTSFATRAFLVERSVDHTTTRPRHPWTNGRIERLFGTFKRTVFAHVWLFASLAQIDRSCRDFVVFYNRDRPHSSYGGLTPDEVHAGERAPRGTRGRITYFDGRMHWYRFG